MARSERHEFKLNPVRRTIGVEIEVAGVRSDDRDTINRVVKFWNGGIVRDGSLPSEGFEINTMPADGDRFIEQISDICSAIRTDEGFADCSCGLHVHVGAKDLRWWEVRRVIGLYAKVEDGLFRVIAPSRRKGQFCVPCGDTFMQHLISPTSTPMLKMKMTKMLYGDVSARRIPEMRKDKYNRARYSALNIHSWMHRGTIEFRHHHGTVNKAKIVNWALLCAALVDKAARMTEAQIDAHPEGVEGLAVIAPTEECKAWVRTRAAHFGNRLGNKRPVMDAEDAQLEAA
jgi:hypothetical protein